MRRPDYSYFPDTRHSNLYAPPYKGTDDRYGVQNIDDLVYRYSSEFDRGTPTVGIYAQDGLWEDEGVGLHTTQLPRNTILPPRILVKQGDTGRKATLRGGKPGETALIAMQKEEKSSKIWTWSKKPNGSPPSDLQRSNDISEKMTQMVDVKNILKKEKSRSQLRGKGRRGELSVAVNGDPDESASHFVEDDRRQGIDT